MLSFDLLTQGFSQYFGLMAVLYTVSGVFAGLIIGIIPGLGPLLGLTLVTPMVMRMPPVAGMALLLGIFVGGACGGSVSAILLGIPGTPIAAATMLDGYPLAKKGQAPFAIGIAIFASSIGGLIGGIYLIFFSPLLAKFALEFGPPEYFALALMGVTCIAVISKESTIKGFISGALGLLIATMGMDLFIPHFRFTLGITALSGGIGIIPMVIGLFALSEVFSNLEGDDLDESPHLKAFRLPLKSLFHIGKKIRVLFQSSTIGAFIGAIPGAGSVIASFIAYTINKTLSKDPESYGKGNPTGIVATESANNACCGGVLIPALTLGIPGDSSSAMLLAALMLLGFIPGVQLFEKSPEIVGGIFWAYIACNMFLFILAFIMMPVFVKVVNIKKKHLLPIVLLISVLGTYAYQTLVSDLWIALFFGLSFFLNKLKYPLSPFIIARVLGPLMEENFRRSLILSGEKYSIFLERPVCLTIILINVLFVVISYLPMANINKTKKSILKK